MTRDLVPSQSQKGLREAENGAVALLPTAQTRLIPAQTSPVTDLWIIDYSGDSYHICGITARKRPEAYGHFLEAILINGQRVRLTVPDMDCYWYSNEKAVKRVQRKIADFLTHGSQADGPLDLRASPCVDSLSAFYELEDLKKVTRVHFRPHDCCAMLLDDKGHLTKTLYTIYGDEGIFVPSKEALFDELRQYVDNVTVSLHKTSGEWEEYLLQAQNCLTQQTTDTQLLE